MKKMAAFLLVLIGLGMVAMYLQPTKSMVNTTVYQERPSHSETTQIQEMEVKTKQATNSTLDNLSDTSQQEPEFYDTKSDPSLQPVDPATDPANEIKQL